MQHRENTHLLDQKIAMVLPVFPEENVGDSLKEMEITGEDGGYFVPFERAQTVRTALSQIKKYTDKEFETSRVEQRTGYPFGGINFWRKA